MLRNSFKSSKTYNKINAYRIFKFTNIIENVKIIKTIYQNIL